MSGKPYQHLGIGDLDSLGQTHAHLFTFKAVEPDLDGRFPNQRWLSRGPQGVDGLGLVVTKLARLYVDVDSPGCSASVCRELTAKQCTDFATQLLTAAMLMELVDTLATAPAAPATTPEQEVAA